MCVPWIFHGFRRNNWHRLGFLGHIGRHSSYLAIIQTSQCGVSSTNKKLYSVGAFRWIANAVTEGFSFIILVFYDVPVALPVRGLNISVLQGLIEERDCNADL